MFTQGWNGALLLSSSWILATMCNALDPPNCSQPLPEIGEPKPPPARCETYNNQLPDGSMGFCVGIVDYDYYLPGGLDQFSLESKIKSQLLSNPDTAKLLPLIPGPCARQLKASICASTFQRCELVDPFFPSQELCACEACRDVENGVIRAGCATAKTADGLCIIGPGKVPGTTRDWNQTTCLMSGLTWKDGQCLAAIGRTPCKGVCDELHAVSEVSKCPEISGMFFSLMAAKTGRVSQETLMLYLQLMQSASDDSNSPTVSVPSALGTMLAPESDSEIVALYDRAISEYEECDIESFGTNDTTIFAMCMRRPFTLNLLSVFGILPSCVDAVDVGGGKMVKLYSSEFVGEISGLPTNQSLGGLIAQRAFMVLNATARDEACNAAGCTRLLMEVSRCVQAENDGERASVQSSLALVQKGHQCEAVVTSPELQPSSVIGLAALAYAASQSLGTRIEIEDARRLYYQPQSVGLPLLPQATGVEDGVPVLVQPVNEPVTGRKSALCSIYGDGTNTVECAALRLKRLLSAVPSYVATRCQADFEAWVCALSMPKLEIQSLCLASDGKGGVACDSTGGINHSVPFTVALPRFPSRATCESMVNSCQGFFDFVVESTEDTGTSDLIERLTDCSQTINVTRDDEVWASELWPNESPFNGLPAFPAEERQVLLNLSPEGGSSLGEKLFAYAKLASISDPATAFGNFGATEVLTPALSSAAATDEANVRADDISQCQCPYPLLVPDNPSAETLRPFLCCQYDCRTPLYSPQTFESWRSLQVNMMVAGAVFGLFILLTWGTFKAKRKQRLTLYFAVATSFTSLCFVLVYTVPSKSASIFCRSNTEAKDQSDGGVCLFQSLSLCFGGLSSACWWWCQSVDLLLKIKFASNSERLIYYHIFSWGFPSFITCLAASLGVLGYSGPSPWCFFKEDAKDGLGRIVMYVGWYFPIGLMIMTAIPMIIVVVRHISAVSRKAQGSTRKGATVAKKMARRLKVYRIPLLFVVVYTVCWSFVFAYRVSADRKRPAILSAAEVYSQCLLENFANGISNPAINASADVTMLMDIEALREMDGLEDIDAPLVEEGSGCGTTSPINSGTITLLLVQIVVCGTGVFVFLIYGLQHQNFMLWYARFTRSKPGRDGTGSRTGGSSTLSRSVSMRSMRRSGKTNGSSMSSATQLSVLSRFSRSPSTARTPAKGSNTHASKHESGTLSTWVLNPLARATARASARASRLRRHPSTSEASSSEGGNAEMAVMNSLESLPSPPEGLKPEGDTTGPDDNGEQDEWQNL